MNHCKLNHLNAAISLQTNAEEEEKKSFADGISTIIGDLLTAKIFISRQHQVKPESIVEAASTTSSEL